MCWYNTENACSPSFFNQRRVAVIALFYVPSKHCFNWIVHCFNWIVHVVAWTKYYCYYSSSRISKFCNKKHLNKPQSRHSNSWLWVIKYKARKPVNQLAWLRHAVELFHILSYITTKSRIQEDVSGQDSLLTVLHLGWKIWLVAHWIKQLFPWFCILITGFIKPLKGYFLLFSVILLSLFLLPSNVNFISCSKSENFPFTIFWQVVFFCK